MILSNEHASNNRPIYKRPKYDNLTPGERRALYELKQNDNIVIKSTHKGNAVCVLQYEDYISEWLRQLTDTKFLQPIDTNLNEKYKKKVQNFIIDLYTNGEMNDSIFRYLQDKQCKTPNMYFLPQIHKGITPPLGRPIVAANGCTTETLSNFIDQTFWH